jgi:hypothetical protein
MESVSTADELVGALDARGVPFLTGGVQSAQALALTPAELLLGLARDQDARVRLAVIPLLLVHPEYAVSALDVANQLDAEALRMFQFYYTAAYWLQRKYAERLTSLLGKTARLPELFSSTLDLSNSEPDAALAALGRRHQDSSGEPINWHGTYEHAAQRLLKQLTLERAWAK